MSLAQNKILRGRYQIHSSLGRGGFGEVYKAKDLHKQGLVAVKETLDSQSIHAFNIEFAILQQVRHPNLPRYYEVFEENGRGYLVMELIPGQSLQQVIDSQRGHPLIESQVIGGYAIQVCDALAYLHSQRPPILHRDIKPENIRLTPEGLVKLVDFGLIKQGTGRTQTLMRGLTPLYAPIEQYGVVTQLHTDERSDVYSLGATLFYLLTAQEPVPVLDRLNEVNSNRGDPQPAPQSVNPRVSPSVSQAIYVAMAIKQNQRYPNIVAFKQALLGINQVPAGNFPQSIPRQPIAPSRQQAVYPPPVRSSNIFMSWVLYIGLVFLFLCGGLFCCICYFEVAPLFIAPGTPTVPSTRRVPTPLMPIPTAIRLPSPTSPPTAIRLPSPTPIPLTNAAANWSPTMGYGNWFYVDGKIGDYSNWTDMRFDPNMRYPFCSNGCWRSTVDSDYVRLDQFGGHPGLNRYVGKLWRSPIAGSIRLAVVAWKVNPGGNGVTIKVIQNSNILQTFDLDGNQTQERAAVIFINTQITVNGWILILAESKGNTDSDQSVFDPTIWNQ